MGGAQYILEEWTIMAIVMGHYSVDTFFFIGGLFSCYLGLKYCAKKKGKLGFLDIILIYLQRYLRLVQKILLPIYYISPLKLLIWYYHHCMVILLHRPYLNHLNTVSQSKFYCSKEVSIRRFFITSILKLYILKHICYNLVLDIPAYASGLNCFNEPAHEKTVPVSENKRNILKL